MSYQVLARKWRPRFFDEMVGQEHVLRALINALNEERLHHAYLFTGTRGVGKTTIARILAKCLNCEQGVSARPCGECSACREISEGRFVDLIEVDAASRTKVEDTRELLDNVQYAPTRGRFKVYLIDEVHMLSTHSFNALLKTLEEPPDHVKFLLATTDPQKLPVTVLSRCLQFSLKNMTPERIVGYLQKVLEAENIGYEEPALWQLGRAAQGSMRDALSLTDQAIAYGEGNVAGAQVNAMLGTMDRGRLFKLAEVMAKAEPAQVMAEVAAMAEHGPDYDEVLQGLLAIWHKAALAQVVPDAIENAEGDREAILQLGMAMQPEDLQLYYQIGLSGRSDLALAPDPRQGFEMILLRMLAFRPAPDAPLELDLDSALQKKKRLTDTNNAYEPADYDAEPASLPAASGPDEGRVPDTEVTPHPSVDSPIEQPSAAEQDSATCAELADADEAAASAGPEATDVPASKPVTESLVDNDTAEQSPVTPGSSSEEHEIAQYGRAAVQAPDVTAEDAADPVASASIAAPAPARSNGMNAASLMDASMDEPAMEASVADIAADSVVNPAASVISETVSAADNRPEQPQNPAAGENAGAAASAQPQDPLQPHTWWQWVSHLKLAGLTMAIARNSALVHVEGDHYEFDVDPVQGALFNDGQAQKIQQALRELFPQATVSMTLQPPRGETPDQRRQRQQEEARYGAKQAIEGDPLVQRVLNEFGGVVVDETIRPVS
ncbi:MAG: hypothetical protein CMH98_02940 [Oceanospirillaceae bacterium]|nr:hypothetical protein [Oceanospirillaceae bacterium]|tara:strand:+ start:187860 stop:190031 length:2172 start_codon:yes stop_codon:yes gene_type:complete